MVKIEIISPGAAATILRNGERQAIFEKQLITYAEAETLEVTGGTVTYSVNETEVLTKSGDTAPAVPQATTEPKLADAAEATVEPVKPAIVKPAAKTAVKAK